MRRKIFIVGLALLVAAGSGLWWLGSSQGFSARKEPTRVETFVARNTRVMAIPSASKTLKNPVQLTPDVLVEGRRHFADHCAMCHANDGGGNTEIGRNLYPKAPDMREKDTQSLSDGELYFIIHNGIRLSGMPAWGAESDADHDQDSWILVHFIRHLPSLSAEEIQDMQQMNPRSPQEMREEREEEEFLKGKTERK